MKNIERNGMHRCCNRNGNRLASERGKTMYEIAINIICILSGAIIGAILTLLIVAESRDDRL